MNVPNLIWIVAVTCVCLGCSAPKKEAVEVSRYDQLPPTLTHQDQKPQSRLNELIEALRKAGFTWDDMTDPETKNDADTVAEAYLFGLRKNGTHADLSIAQYAHGRGPYIGERHGAFDSTVIRVGDYSVYWDKKASLSFEDARDIKAVLEAFQK